MNKIKTNIVYNSDCLKKLSNIKTFPDNSIDLIVTSPPYSDQRKNTYGGIKAEIYVDWFMPIADQMKRVLKPNGSLILNIKENVKKGERQTYVIELILEMKRNGWYWVEEYCWYKKNSFPGKWNNRFRDNWERCLHFTKSKKFKMYQDAVKVPIGDWTKSRFKSLSKNDFERSISKNNKHFGRNVSNWLNKKKVYPHNVIVFENEHYFPSNVLHFPTACNNKNHSAAYPIELPFWFIKLFTRKGDIVLDPFLGSGTTAVAAKLLDRKYIGIEILKEYVELSRRNIKS